MWRWVYGLVTEKFCNQIPNNKSLRWCKHGLNCPQKYETQQKKRFWLLSLDSGSQVRVSIRLSVKMHPALATLVSAPPAASPLTRTELEREADIHG